MLVEIETVLMVVIAYIIGLLSITFFNRYRASTSQTVAQYESRFKEYEDMLVDMRVKLDTLELRSDVSQVSQEVGDVSDANHKPKAVRRSLEQEGKGLVDYVLKLLVEGPKSSRQIETVIGRSREHTARLMKKLFELGYVTRDTKTKPYTYAITDVGKTMLSQVASATSKLTD
jgi:DNA-binding HxlR family transcriptional regulator